MQVHNPLHQAVATPFVILFFERSGSTYLIHLLNSHPSICCRGEIFDVDKIGNDFVRSSPHKSTESALATLHNTFHTPKNIIASGFKYKIPWQWSCYADVWRELRRTPNLKVIGLVRENRIKHALSCVALRQTEAHRFNERGEMRRHAPMHVPLNEFHYWLRTIEQYHQPLIDTVRSFPQHLLVSYEDITIRSDSTLPTILQFLGVDDTVALSTRTAKVTHDNLREAISNYDEFQQSIATTPWAKFVSK